MMVKMEWILAVQGIGVRGKVEWVKKDWERVLRVLIRQTDRYFSPRRDFHVPFGSTNNVFLQCCFVLSLVQCLFFLQFLLLM